KPPYKFVLLFRGSRDGFQNNLFHEKCDQKGATIVVAKIQNSNQLVGGYTPVDWDTSGQNKSSTDSFIFSLSDLTNLSNANLGRISSSYYSYAIYCDKSCGPYFGNGNLHFNRNCINVSDNGYYSNVGIPNGSQIEDYEVFQVIKNDDYDVTIYTEEEPKSGESFCFRTRAAYFRRALAPDWEIKIKIIFILSLRA
ncbi:155_t:CDS:2, partial [Gigaspora rosea]